MAKINNDIDSLEKALNERAEVRFVYVKRADNSIREAIGTRRLDCIPKFRHPTGRGRTRPRQLAYYDLECEGWRSLCRSQLLGWIEDER